VSGDTNSNNKLDTNETWIFEASGTSVSGNYSNTGTATGSVTDSAGHTRSTTASDTSSYFGENPQIAINKVTVDGSTSRDSLNILSGEPIKWRSTDTNTDNQALTKLTGTALLPTHTPPFHHHQSAHA